MTQQKKYIWLRNISLLSICGFLCYSLFPFPPITWRLLFLGTAILVIWPNMKSLSRLEKTVMGFWGLNLIYFFVSYLFLDNPSTTQIGNISVTLLSIPLFITLGKKGVMTERFYSIAVVLLLLSAMIYFESMRVLMLAKFINRNDVINNASVVFLFILPFILFLKNRYLSYLVTLICVYYLMEGAKRGNIICAIPVLFLFILSTFRNKQVKFYEKLVFVVFLLFATSWGVEKFVENEHLQARVEQTMEGESSNRDIIYKNAWRTFAESENIRNVLFGYGFDGTLHHPKIKNYAHNDWLEILVDCGALGAFFYFSIFFLLFMRIRKEKDLQKYYVLITVFAIWLLKSAFSMGFTEETMFILFIAWGYVCQMKDNESQKRLLRY